MLKDPGSAPQQTDKPTGSGGPFYVISTTYELEQDYTGGSWDTAEEAEEYLQEQKRKAVAANDETDFWDSVGIVKITVEQIPRVRSAHAPEPQPETSAEKSANQSGSDSELIRQRDSAMRLRDLCAEQVSTDMGHLLYLTAETHVYMCEVLIMLDALPDEIIRRLALSAHAPEPQPEISAEKSANQKGNDNA